MLQYSYNCVLTIQSAWQSLKQSDMLDWFELLQGGFSWVAADIDTLGPFYGFLLAVSVPPPPSFLALK